MAASAFDVSKTAGIHQQLNKMTGEWRGVTKTWSEPGIVADESPMTGTIRSVLDGRFLVHEYKGSLSEKSFSGIGIYGYDLNTNKFQTAWVDSFHMSTGIMFSESESHQNNFAVSGSYMAGTEKWGWHTTIELMPDGTLVITAYNVFPSGQKEKATETIYTKIQD